MNGTEVLRIVDAIHRDKNIDQEIVFEGIEQAILSAARKHFGEEREVTVDIDRQTGEPSLKCDGKDLEPDVLGEILGRIAAQTAKQVMIQKIREAERDSLFEEFVALRGQCMTGNIARFEGGSAIVSLGKIEGILPRGEQIPGESHRIGERIRAVIIEVKKSGSRVKIILSRTHPDLVLRLFELEIPEISERIIEVRSLAREAGYRSKVAVSCFDTKIDCVGACVGVRGSRIKNIVDELSGERIDIVRWNDSLQVLVPNAMQPAEAEDVILCPMLGRVIVLVRDDQLSLAIGKRGQNVRLASKLVGWDIEVMTRDELDEQLDKSVEAFGSVPGVSDELAESLVAQGFFSFYDLSVIEPDQLAELGGLTADECDAIVAFADEESIRQEREEEERRIQQAEERERERAKAAEEADVSEESEASEDAEEDSGEVAEETADEVSSDSPAEDVAGETEGMTETADAVASESVEKDSSEDAATESEESAATEDVENTPAAVPGEENEESHAPENEVSVEAAEDDGRSHDESETPRSPAEESPTGETVGS